MKAIGDTPSAHASLALSRHQEHAETMRIESWAAGSKVERNCPVLTEYLFIEGGAQEGALRKCNTVASCFFKGL